MTRKPSIALIGLRGCGKTTVGRLLAGQMKLPFVDTDEIVVTSAGCSIVDIFSREGEAGFRVHERRAVVLAVAASPAVISLGGGAVLDPVNRAAICRVATVAWLTASPEELWRRISQDPSTVGNRPTLTSLSGVNELRQLHEVREAIYRNMADLTMKTCNKNPADIAREITEKLRAKSP